MRNKRFKILSALQELKSSDAFTLLTAYSSSELWRSFRNIERKRAVEKLKTQTSREEEIKFYNLLNRLQKDGLVEKSKKKGEKMRWRITRKGREEVIKIKTISAPLVKEKAAQAQRESHMKIVTFDIPETKRVQRNVVRDVLKKLNYKMLQKSVWIGHKKIPKEFLEHLKKNNLVSHVHIFEVKKQGSI